MALINMTHENYHAITSKKEIVMVDCWAEWCSACQSFNPIYEKVSENYPGHTFAKLNAVDEKSLVSELGIEHIPTLLLFRDGFLLFQQPGYYEEDKLKDIIKQAENVDMDEVRAHFEGQHKQADS